MDYFTRIIFRFINVHVTLISRIIHVYGIHVYSGKDLDAFNFAKTCHREIKVTLKLSTYTVYCILFWCAQVKSLQCINSQPELDHALSIHDRFSALTSFRIVLSPDNESSPTPDNVSG